MEGPTWWGVQVGPWSEWVAAILTGGSLLLGFYILLRDRRKEETAQANRVGYINRTRYEKQDGAFGHLTMTVTIHNGSDRFITNPFLI
jgi:hypothetical protein